MKHHKQTLFGDGSDGTEPGNCFATAIACVLDREIAEVPNFCSHRDWYARLIEWLKPKGWAYVEYKLQDTSIDADLSDSPISMLGYCIISGPAARGLNHSVVGYAGKPIHDPHPSGAMLLEHHFVGVFVPLNPVCPRNGLGGLAGFAKY